MEILKINDLSFQYPESNEYVLDNISLNVRDGEFVVICGPSGCGKTTLLRMLKQELAPVGKVSGDILYSNKLMSDWDQRILIEDIGLVFQNPENQIVMDEVLQEIVFGMENLNYSHFEMRKRIAEMVHFFGVEDLLTKKPSELSGGQMQIVNLLSVLLLKPKILLLDEPTSQLDPVTAKELIVMLERLNKEMGMTIIIVEHRLEELFAIADSIHMMKSGKIVHTGSDKSVISNIYQNEDTDFIPYLPSVARLYMETENNFNERDIPLTVKDCRSWIQSTVTELSDTKNTLSINNQLIKIYEDEPLIELKNVFFQYDKEAVMILKNLTLSVNRGEYFSLIGGNGSGKSTLLKICIGLIKAQRGTVNYNGHKISKLKDKEFYEQIAYLPQNPQTYFIHDTVEKEMVDVLHKHNIDNGSEKMKEMLNLFQIEHLLHRHPHDCSGGELQRAALACMLLGEPEVLFIDEPTKGLDPISKNRLGNLLNELHQKGLTIIMVTHDIEFAAQHVESTAMMFDGEISVKGSPEDLFKDNYFYTTAINRATRMLNVSESLTLEEALSTWPNHVYS